MMSIDLLRIQTTSYCLVLLLLTFGLSAETLIQVGPFEFDYESELESWSTKPSFLVTPVLQREGYGDAAEFLLVSPSGSRIYGMFWESKNAAITAEKILPVAVPDDWYTVLGLERNAVTTEIWHSPAGADAVVIKATCRGDGYGPIKSGTVASVAIWVIIPVVFEQEDFLRSGIVRLFFRSVAETTEKSDSDSFWRFVEGMKVASWTSMRTRSDFYYYLGGLNWHRNEGISAQTVKETMLSRKPRDSHDDWLQWTQVAISGHKHSLSQRVAALESLLGLFPANPSFQDELLIIKPREAEKRVISEILALDSNGETYRILGELHRKMIARLRETASYDELFYYLEYLEDVWPCNPILNPQWRDNPGMSWELPQLGVPMLFQKPDNGEPYWISREPVVQLIAQHARRGQYCLEPIDCDRDSIATAIDITQCLDLQLPTRAQYHTLAGTKQQLLSESKLYLTRSENGGLSQTGLILKSGKLKETRIVWSRNTNKVDFFVVKEHPSSSNSFCGPG